MKTQGNRTFRLANPVVNPVVSSPLLSSPYHSPAGHGLYAGVTWWHFRSVWYTPQGELPTLAQMGRAENLELMIATQLPHKVNASVTGQATELVCFRVDEPLALARAGAGRRY